MTMSTLKNQFIPYGRQNISEEDIAAVVKVMQGPYLTQGPAVPDFEQAVACEVGSRFGVAVNSATSALHVACLSLGLGPGDYLWTSAITFVASANCGRYCGAFVDFVDIDPATGLISIEALTAKLELAEVNGNLPKVLVTVHLCGTSCDMQSIAGLAQKYGFAVVEDASHAIGGRYCGNPVGNCKYSNITVFSFHPVKIITTGEGGLATTNNPDLERRMKELRCHGITKNPERFEQISPGPWSYEQQDLGFNYRMTDLQAALGLSQLSKLDNIVSERNRQYKRYQELIDKLPVRLLDIPGNVISSVHLAVIRIVNCSSTLHRKVFEGFRSADIGVQLHYCPVHLQPYYRKLGFCEGDLPEAESYATSAISLPLFPGLSDFDQQRVIRTLELLLDP
jgi:UDP-4-amino-4,6-dideoxy-N-acetyl-beta-L-altrosamine transaminase